MTLAVSPGRRLPVVQTGLWLVGLVCMIVALAGALAHSWTCDDAYISFRYARNLIEGHGLVFNPGERVEGYTNFLWTIWIAVGLGLGAPAAGWAAGWGIACYLGSIALLLGHHFHLRRRLGWHGFTVPVAAIGAAVHREWMIYATAGLETALYTLVLLSLYSLLVARPLTRGRLVGIGVVLGIASLTRPDGVLFVPLALLFVLHRARGARIRSLAIVAATFAMIWLPFMGWRWSYYGDLFPNTYYAKSAYLVWYSQGFTYVGLYFSKYWPLLLSPLLLLLAWRRGTRAGRGASDLPLAEVALAFGFALVYVLYIARVGGDFMFGRMLIPITPMLLLLLEIGVVASLRRLWAQTPSQIAASVAVAAAFVLTPVPVGQYRWVAGIADEWLYYNEAAVAKKARRAAVLREYFEGLDARVAFFGAEAQVVYRGRVPVAIDAEAGLTDRTIARQRLQKRGRVGHEKHASLEYLIYEREVNFVFTQHGLDLLRYEERLPYAPIWFDGQRGFILHWDPPLLRELARRGAKFKEFPRVLDNLLSNIDRLSQDQLETVLERAKLFYFDHVSDPRRLAALENRLDELRSR